MRIEMAKRESVGCFVMHGQENLARLNRVSDKCFCDQRTALGFNDYPLFGPHTEPPRICGVDLDVDSLGVELA
jgi:hypothetical protein